MKCGFLLPMSRYGSHVLAIQVSRNGLSFSRVRHGSVAHDGGTAGVDAIIERIKDVAATTVLWLGITVFIGGLGYVIGQHLS